MNSFVFVHIPKTAGTSFRRGAERFFGAGTVCCDYGHNAPETSEIIQEWIYRRKDFWGFSKVFGDMKHLYIVGHFPANKYAPLFGVERMVTFLRDPVKRVISEYWHYVRDNGYKDTFQTFYRTPQFINRQFRNLQGIPWVSLGFTGITEKYKDSLALFNSKYELAIPLLVTNVGKAPEGETFSISVSDESEIRKLNANELSLYDQTYNFLQQRVTLAEKRKPFVRGVIGGINKGTISGWAVFDDNDDPVTIDILTNGEIVGTAKAIDFRPPLRQIGIRRGGYVGYSLKPLSLKAGDTIECRVAETGQLLIGTPYKVAVEQINH